ncbi:type IV pilus assembly protein PilM [bacterium]|nr:type IV pilus assembly protein PilM [bacterium]
MLFSGDNKSYPLGIDISDYSIKMVELEKSGSDIRIQCMNKISLPSGVIEEGEIKDEKRAVDFLHSLIEKPFFGKVNSDRVVACLPESRSFVKLIEISSGFGNLSEAIEAEIEKHIPFSSQEIYIDWQEIEKKNNKHLILVGVAPKKIVDQYYNLFTKANLSVEALEIEPLAIVRSVLEEEDPNYKTSLGKNYIVVDLGYAHTNVFVYSKNTILFTFSVPVSGKKITRTIAEKLDIKELEADKMKKKLTEKSKYYKEVKNILDDYYKQLDQKLGRVLEFYYENFSDRGRIEGLVLLGGGAHLKNLKNSITSLPPSVDIVKGNPLLHISLTEKSEALLKKNDKLIYSTAVGLALSGIFKKEL